MSAVVRTAATLLLALAAAALGLYFTPQVAQLVAGLWWAILLAILWALGLGWLMSLWLLRRHGAAMGVDRAAQRATSYFAGAVGGASEMTLLAEREGARSDLVAAAHSARILIVTLLVPFAFTLLDLHGSDATLPGPRTHHLPGLLLLYAAVVAGALLAGRARMANPWFMGPLIVAMGLTMAGVELSAVPRWLTNLAQLALGVSLGVRFQRQFVRAAPAWLAGVVLGTVAMILLSGVAGALLAWVTGLNPGTLILGTAPGGIAEMAITARALQLGVPVVTAFQVCRVVAVLVLVGPLYRWGFARA